MPNIMVWHVRGTKPPPPPGSPSESVEASVPEAWVAAYEQSVAARLADGGGDDDSDDYGRWKKKAAEPTPAAVGAAGAPAPLGTPGTLARQSSRQAAPKTLPPGPAMWEYVPVWLRKESYTQDYYTYTKKTVWASMGDNLVLSLPAARERQRGGGPVTNRTVRAEIRRRVQRYVLPAQRERFNAMPDAFHVRYFLFDNSKRGMCNAEGQHENQEWHGPHPTFRAVNCAVQGSSTRTWPLGTSSTLEICKIFPTMTPRLCGSPASNSAAISTTRRHFLRASMQRSLQ
jgi:hypothetical protein